MTTESKLREALRALDGCNWLDDSPTDIPDLKEAKRLARGVLAESESKDHVELASRLRSWAQNEEMVGVCFTAHGLDCNTAADALTQTNSAVEKYRIRAQVLACGLQDAFMALGRLGGNYVLRLCDPSSVTVKHADIRRAWEAARTTLASLD